MSERAIDPAAIESRPELTILEEQLFGHVLDCVDLDALFGIEQLLWGLIDRAGVGDDDGDIANEMIARAFARVGRDPARHISDVPYGITKAEIKAVRFDPDCPFCQFEAEQTARVADAAHDHGDEPCALCDDLVRGMARAAPRGARTARPTQAAQHEPRYSTAQHGRR